MSDEMDTTNLNHKFAIKGPYEFSSDPASLEEITKAREYFDSQKHDANIAFRSCWVCNGAHVHLIESPRLRCFSCGKVFVHGVDITDYSDGEYKELTHIKGDK